MNSRCTAFINYSKFLLDSIQLKKKWDLVKLQKNSRYKSSNYMPFTMIFLSSWCDWCHWDTFHKNTVNPISHSQKFYHTADSDWQWPGEVGRHILLEHPTRNRATEEINVYLWDLTKWGILFTSCHKYRLVLLRCWIIKISIVFWMINRYHVTQFNEQISSKQKYMPCLKALGIVFC